MFIMWDTVAQWLECQTVSQEDQGISGSVAQWLKCQTVSQEDQGSSDSVVRMPDCQSRGSGYQWLSG